ncbi:MAG: peptidoglycan bridge formation glycyltransferase FemA/FemB family protein [Mariniphaga sp.]|nr:peptidoglycan bridge formation glycyltransferase FemA/FemB family protein [Mariniphaga sp.]MDD4426543.1 peptidoglycan bridge formation glycyltransferase FemA/FemB family protein [Mariniphaga sp.]
MQIKEIKIEELRPTNVFPQTPFWGRIKNKQGYISRGFEFSASKKLLTSSVCTAKNIYDDLLLLIRYIDHQYCYAYIPYGPTQEPDIEHQGVFLEELSEQLRSYLPSNCIFIRYDLKWQNQWAQEDDYYDSGGNWTGPPQTEFQEFRINYNTVKWNLRKSPVDILPRNTFFLDLTQKEDELLREMRYNTRYNIKRALNKGIKVQEYGSDQINEWYQLYTDTAIRHHLPLQDKTYFSDILKNQDNEPEGVRVKLLMAEKEGLCLASMFLVLSNKRGIYLYGASSADNKHFMASYALQWEAIKLAKKKGCIEFDMFGAAPNLNKSHPLYGIHVYKKGFGGALYHRMGCWDYPYLPEIYEIYKMQEMQGQ